MPVPPKLVGRMTVGVLIILFSLLALIYAFSSKGAERTYHIWQALVFSVLALTGGVCYRYFED